MRIFTKKSFEFKNADGEKEVTRPLDFNDVPDWVVNDPIFGWGVKDKDITVTETAKEEAAAEKAAEDTDAQAKAAAEAAAKVDVTAEQQIVAEAKAKADAGAKADANKGK